MNTSFTLRKNRCKTTDAKLKKNKHKRKKKMQFIPS
jgi:hypothetical protein